MLILAATLSLGRDATAPDNYKWSPLSHSKNISLYPNRSPIHQHNADDADVSSLTQCHILTPPMIHIVNGMWFMWNIFCSQRQPSSVCDVFWFKNSCDVTSIMITRWKSGLNREAEIYWRNSSGSQRNRWYSHQC